MRTNLETTLADMARKRQQLRWEPLNMVIAWAGAGAALFGAALAFRASALRHLP